MGGNYGNMDRGNSHRKRGNRGGNRNNNKGGNFKSHSKGQWQTSERLTEEEAGITQFISSTPGFHGIIKSRYSDFHVNEVDLEGNEAVLTDFSLPEVAEDAVDIGKDFKAELKEFIGDEKIEAVNALVKSEMRDQSVKIEVSEYDKDKRTALHKCLKAVFGKSIFTATLVEEDKKFIQVKKFTKGGERNFGWQWGNEFTCFVLHKENIDTLQAIADLSHQLRMKPASFAYAGTKDKRAKTSQWISARKLEPVKIVRAASKCQGVRVGNFKFIKEGLRLGNLKGNRFRIALRSIKGDQDEIVKSLESLREFGFINYYGLQRFGNCKKIPTYMVGKALLSGDFQKACELILQERDGEPFWMEQMRNCYTKTKDPELALKSLRATSTCVEARLLHGLKKHGKTNFLQALTTLPRNMLMLYSHSYQSFIWNQVVCKRRELGLKVIEGDLVFTKTAEVVEEVVDEAPEEEDAEGAADETVPESKFLAMVRPLTKEDVESGLFTINDIVLPLPGFDVKYPSNEIADYYVELLAKDNLTSETLKSKHSCFSLTGAYRKVFAKADNFTWKFMKYQTERDDLIISDYSRMLKDPEPEDKADGEHLALVLDFVLSSSTYATMALRELLKSDTSVGNQIVLQNELKKAEEETTRKRQAETENVTDDETKKIKIE